GPREVWHLRPSRFWIWTAPEGQLNLAQRFIAGSGGYSMTPSSPVGTIVIPKHIVRRFDFVLLQKREEFFLKSPPFVVLFLIFDVRNRRPQLRNTDTEGAIAFLPRKAPMRRE